MVNPQTLLDVGTQMMGAAIMAHGTGTFDVKKIEWIADRVLEAAEVFIERWELKTS